MKVIGIHAHESNIAYMEKLFREELLMEHILVKQTDLARQGTKLMRIIEEQLTEEVSAFLITCTLYSSLIEESEIHGVPILKIEDPLIENMLKNGEQKKLFFSNPETVDLTVSKIEQSYRECHKELDYQVILIPNIFALIMSGQNAYSQAIKKAISYDYHAGDDSEFGGVETVFNAAQAAYSN